VGVWEPSPKLRIVAGECGGNGVTARASDYRRQTDHQTRAGFTLIEALLAVAIMSMSAFAFLSLTSQCLGVASLSRRYHDAVMIMDRGNLDYPLLMTNEVYDNVVAPMSFDGGYVFTRDVVEDEDEEDLFIVRTRVSWSKRGKKSFEEVETYIYSTNHP
jgi:prepilin-type N-terminal cleavage/methylation domain-containing protein